MGNTRKHLYYSAIGSYLSNEFRHPQLVMKELNIEYKYAEPNPIADCWIFLDCSNIPDELPNYLSYANYDDELADRIINRIKS